MMTKSTAVGQNMKASLYFTAWLLVCKTIDIPDFFNKNQFEKAVILRKCATYEKLTKSIFDKKPRQGSALYICNTGLFILGYQ